MVLGSGRLNAELQKSLGQKRTSLGEAITVVQLDKSEGVVERDEAFMQQTREAAIKEYFFGDAKMTLSPATQQVDFSAVTIYKIPDCMFLPPFLLVSDFYLFPTSVLLTAAQYRIISPTRKF